MRPIVSERGPLDSRFARDARPEPASRLATGGLADSRTCRPPTQLTRGENGPAEVDRPVPGADCEETLATGYTFAGRTDRRHAEGRSLTAARGRLSAPAAGWGRRTGEPERRAADGRRSRNLDLLSDVLLQVIAARQAIGRLSRSRCRSFRSHRRPCAGRASRVAAPGAVEPPAIDPAGVASVRMKPPPACAGAAPALRPAAAAAPPPAPLPPADSRSQSSTGSRWGDHSAAAGVLGVRSAGRRLLRSNTNRERSAQHRPENQLTLHANLLEFFSFRVGGAEGMAAPGTAPERFVMVGADSDAAPSGWSTERAGRIWPSGTRAIVRDFARLSRSGHARDN